MSEVCGYKLKIDPYASLIAVNCNQINSWGSQIPTATHHLKKLKRIVPEELKQFEN